MLKFNKIVVLSATLVASFFCTYKYRAFAGPRENLLAYMTNSFIREDMAHYSGEPCKFKEEVKAFCSRVLHSLYTSLKKDTWWMKVYMTTGFFQTDSVSDPFKDRIIFDLYLSKPACLKYKYTVSDVAKPRDPPALKNLFEDFPEDIRKALTENFDTSKSIDKSAEFVSKDAEKLTNFLLSQFHSGYSFFMDRREQLIEVPGLHIFMKETLAQAFKNKEISLEGLSNILESKKGTVDKDLLECITSIIEEGDFFKNKFIDLFLDTFAKREIFVMLRFCGDCDIPSSGIAIAYGVKTFKICKVQEVFKTLDNRKLFAVEDYIADILNKRNVMLHTALMEASDKNDRERTVEFFQRMTEKLEDAKRNVQSLLEQRHSDSQFWKNESKLDYKEIKKIFDELGCDADRVF